MGRGAPVGGRRPLVTPRQLPRISPSGSSPVWLRPTLGLPHCSVVGARRMDSGVREAVGALASEVGEAVGRGCGSRSTSSVFGFFPVSANPVSPSPLRGSRPDRDDPSSIGLSAPTAPNEMSQAQCVRVRRATPCQAQEPHCLASAPGVVSRPTYSAQSSPFAAPPLSYVRSRSSA